jgi:hypothetical protein
MRVAACLAIVVAVVAFADACPPFSEQVGANAAESSCVICDCLGVCRDASIVRRWPADGSCDEEYRCAALGYDGGDCAETEERDWDIILTENTFRGKGSAIEG